MLTSLLYIMYTKCDGKEYAESMLQKIILNN